MSGKYMVKDEIKITLKDALTHMEEILNDKEKVINIPTPTVVCSPAEYELIKNLPKEDQLIALYKMRFGV